MHAQPSARFLAEHLPSPSARPISTRRDFLQHTGMGMGLLSMASLLPSIGSATPSAPTTPTGGQVLHYPAKAKHLIHIFLEGAPSHIDTWDPKPALLSLDGRSLPAGEGLAFASPFTFQKHGQSGIEISEVFPHLAQHADEMTVIRSMWTDIPAHETATIFMNTGSLRLPRPSLGAWSLYGLGSLNENLPGFVSLRGPNLPNGGSLNWQSSFLPGNYQATSVNTDSADITKIIENLRNQFISLPEQRRQIDLVQSLNKLHHQALENDSQLESEIASMEMAFRMQTEATEAFDLRKEPEHIKTLYGLKPTNETARNSQNTRRANPAEAGRRLLTARRLIERGVRTVQVWFGGWDMHGNLRESLQSRAGAIDQAIAALLTDLKQRGLLDSTLVVWGGEFGRTPGRDRNGQGETAGRDHNARGFSCCMAGGGVKKGHIHGATDDIGHAAVLDKVHVHDLHATILRLLGFDHTKLTYRYNGRDFRLTDVAGKIVHPIIA